MLKYWGTQIADLNKLLNKLHIR